MQNMVCSNMQFNDPTNCEDQPDDNGEEEQEDQHMIEEEEEIVGQEGEEDDTSVVNEQEYAMLDKQLDDLNSVLDLLESKNDRIQAQLKALLENSREIRQSLAEERTTDGGTPKN